MNKDIILDEKKTSKNYERDQEIVKLAKEGKQYQEIAAKYGLTKARINQIALKAGVVRRPDEISDTWKEIWENDRD